MAFYRRKMFSGFINATISQTCDFYCDTSRNKVGYCPTSCLSICSENCREFTQFPSLVPPQSPPPTFIDHRNKPNKLSFFLTLSLSLLAATFFIFFCYTIYKYYTERPRSMRRRSQTETEETRDDFLDEDHGPVLDHPIWYIRTIGLQPSIINAITVCKYKRGDGLVEGTDCSVCLSEFQEDETLRLLPKCNHAFHIPCIDTWLRSHTNCPMCRAGIVSNSPPPEQNVEISVLGEVIQEGTLENSTESGREREDGACELRIGIEEEDELLVENETKRQDVANSDLSEGDEVQPRRRSVSLDSSSASMISLAIANALPVQSDGNSGNQLVKMNESNRGFVPKRFDVNKSLLKLMGTSSIGRSLPRGPISMKRSLSCSGKVLLSKYSQSRSRNRNSVLPQ